MLTVGDRFPAYELEAVVSGEPGKEFQKLTDQSFAGKWKVLFLWPMDFTFVCPTKSPSSADEIVNSPIAMRRSSARAPTLTTCI